MINIFTTLLATALLFLAGADTTDAKPRRKTAKYVFKIATLAPTGSVWFNQYKTLADEILTGTDGNVKFKCYPGGVQGDEATVVRKMRIRQLHGAGFTGNGLSLVCKNSVALQLPLIFDSYEEIDHVFPKIEPILRKECEGRGFEVLGWPEIGFSFVFSSSVVRDMQSLRQSKPWLLQDDIISQTFFNVAKSNAIYAQVGDVLTALRTGLIDTVFSPPVGMLSMQWFTGVENRLDTKIAYSFGSFLVVKKRWDKIPKTTRNTIRKLCEARFGKLNDTIRKQNQEALVVLEKKGIKTISLTDAGLEGFRMYSTQVADELAGSTYSRETLTYLRSLLSKYRNAN